MVKKARIVHDSPPIDFALGIHNIVRRKGNVCYYAIETFHSSPFWNKTTPVFASDVHSSANILEIYGSSGIRALKDNIIILNNHPIRRVRMVGRITEYFIKELGSVVYYFLSIDDTSGDEIICKILKSKFLGAGLNQQGSEGTLVEVIGFLNCYNNKYELHVDFLTIMNNGVGYFKEECSFWNDAFQIRDILMVPWVQSAQIDDEEDVINYKVDSETSKRKLIQKDLRLHSMRPSGSSLVLDSSIYIRKKNFSRTEVDIDSEEEVISEFEEDNDSLFEKGTLKTLPLLLNQSRNKNKNWVRISNLNNLSHKSFDSKSDLVVRLIKWMIKNNETRFHLNKPYKNQKIVDFLLTVSKQSCADEVIDLTISNVEIKTLNQIHGELFHQARHVLQKGGFIVCTKSKNCDATVLIEFFNELRLKLKFIKENKLILKLDNFIKFYNQNFELELDLDFNILEMITFWILGKENDSNWRYNETDNEWSYQANRFLRS